MKATPSKPAALAILAALLMAAFGCDEHNNAAGPTQSPAAPGAETKKPKDPNMTNKVARTDAEWKRILTPEQYYITRQKGTEAPFTGKYWNFKDPGAYRCVGCGSELFTSETRFDSGCGWPSFWAPADANNTKEARDTLGSDNIWHHLGGFNVEGDCYETQQYYFEKDLDDFWNELVGPYETLRQEIYATLGRRPGMYDKWRKITLREEGTLEITFKDGKTERVHPPPAS